MWTRVAGGPTRVWSGAPLAGLSGVFGEPALPVGGLATFAPSDPPRWEAGAIGPAFGLRSIPASRGPQYGPYHLEFPGPASGIPGESAKLRSWPNNPRIGCCAGLGAVGASGPGGGSLLLLLAVAGAAWWLFGRKGAATAGFKSKHGEAVIEGWEQAQDALYEHKMPSAGRLLKELTPYGSY